MADIFIKALGTKKLYLFKGLLVVLEMYLSLRGSIEISSSISDVTHRLLSFMSEEWLVVGVVDMLPLNNNCMIATLACGICGIVRLLGIYGLASHHGPCTLGLEILGIPLVHV